MSDVAYDRRFYAFQGTGSARSADIVAAHVTSLVNPTRVVDVGCGVGAWLAAFSRAGATELLGIDGDYVDRSLLQIDQTTFHPADLEEPLEAPGTFDLAVSMEVAEHLTPGRGPSFVSDLTRLAPVVLFSAAIPGQGGTDHINERPQSYWAALFESHGYRTIDAVRPFVWNDQRVEPWYSQNALLYAAEGVDIPAAPPALLDVVHPRCARQRTVAELLVDRVRRAIPPSVRKARHLPADLRPARRRTH